MHKPYAKHVLLIATNYNPKYALKHSEKFKNTPFAKEVLLVAAERETWYTVLTYLAFKDQPWAKEVLMTAIKNLGSHETYDLKETLLSLSYLKNSDKKLFELIKKTLEPKSKKLKEIVDSLMENIIKILKPKDVEEFRIKLLSDPALKNILKISDTWIQPMPSSKRKLIKFKVMIARNLYFKGLPITKQNVQNEFKNIREYISAYSSLPLFLNRNVVFVAHNEKIGKKKRNRFGTDATINSIKGQSENFNLIRPKDTLPSLKRKKAQMLNLIANSPPPFTFVFDGHGGPNALYLSEGKIKNKKPQETQNTIKITYQEFAKALKKRRKKYPNESNPIFIFSSCYSHTFLRKVYAAVGRRKSNMVSLGVSEYNQYGFSDYSSKYGCKFMENILDLESGYFTTIGTIIKNEYSGHSNPSLYVPIIKGGIMQIVERDRRKNKRANILVT